MRGHFYALFKIIELWVLGITMTLSPVLFANNGANTNPDEFKDTLVKALDKKDGEKKETGGRKTIGQQKVDCKIGRAHV